MRTVAATSCAYASATTVVVVIGTGTTPGAGTVEVTFTNSGVAATVVGLTLTVVDSPISYMFRPIAGYASSTITVTGTNFIIPSQGGDCLNGTTVGGMAVASCTISSVTIVLVVLGASSAGSSVSVVLTFNGGGPGAQATKTGLVVLATPTMFTFTPRFACTENNRAKSVAWRLNTKRGVSCSDLKSHIYCLVC